MKRLMFIFIVLGLTHVDVLGQRYSMNTAMDRVSNYETKTQEKEFIFTDTLIDVKDVSNGYSFSLIVDKVITKNFMTQHPEAIWYFCTDPDPGDSTVKKYIIVITERNSRKSIHFFSIVDEVSIFETIYTKI